MSSVKIIRRTFDVDIDVNSSVKRESYGTRAMVYNSETLRILPHPSGVYLEEVPVDRITGLCSFDYNYGDEAGFSKIDILTNKSYDLFSSKQDLLRSLNQKVDWNWLMDEDFVAKLPHIANHFDTLTKIKPETIEELADTIALIRPAKIGLIRIYRKNTIAVRKRLYSRPLDGSAYFKKSHAIAYASMIVAVMNKLKNPSGIIW